MMPQRRNLIMRVTYRVLVVGLVVAVWASAAGTARAQPKAQGRAAAQKASRFAADGKCVKAVLEYTKAFRILKDPAILFNRAECRRTMGQHRLALEDYEGFLKAMPEAPNRTLADERVAEMRSKLGMPALAAGDEPARPEPRLVPPTPADNSPPPRDPEPEPRRVADSTMTPSFDEPETSPVEPDSADVALSTEAPEALEDDDDGFPVWGWIAIGAVVVAAGAVAGFLVLGQKDTEIPPSDLGNFKVEF
jgi:tetratricopeptide (TPR) repeat protein